MAEASTAVVIAEPQPRPAKVPLVAGNHPRAIVPTDFEGAWRISNAVVAARMAPKSLETVEACTVAILHGLEVGLTPMMALQSIAVINGRPSIWGDGALALIQASGLLEDMDEYCEGEEGKDTLKAVCMLKRKGRQRPVLGEFSVADAKRAGLFGKAGPWQGYLKRMLKMRARAFALRDGFADVLKGLSVAEEQEDVERARQQDRHADHNDGPPAPANDENGPPAPAEAAPGGEQVGEEEGPPVPGEDSAETEQPKPAAPASDFDEGIPDYLRRQPEKPPISDGEREWLESLENAFASCEDLTSLAEEQDRLMTPQQHKVSAPAWDEACDKLDQHVERVQANGD